MTTEEQHYVATVTSESTHLTPPLRTALIRTSTGAIVEPTETNYDETIFPHSLTKDDFIVTVNVRKSLSHYALESGANPKLKRKITIETFKKLPVAISHFYSKVEEESEEFEVLHENLNIFNMEDYVKENPEIIVLTRVEALQKLIELNFKGINKRARIEKSIYAGLNVKEFTVVFMQDEYSGARRKIYDQKKNGGRYADGRGRMVPDYPQTLAKVTIPIDRLPVFTARSQEELCEKLQAYFDHITQTLKLPA